MSHEMESGSTTTIVVGNINTLTDGIIIITISIVIILIIIIIVIVSFIIMLVILALCYR